MGVPLMPLLAPVLGAVFSSMLAPKQQSAAAPEVSPPPQPTRAPDQAAIRKQPIAASGTGTMLTGPQGVDPNSLQLGKNTLLGG
jgi:hypothetical protein